MLLILIRRYKIMAMRTLSICLFIFLLFLSMLLYPVLKTSYATSIAYQGNSISIERDEYNIP